MTAYVPKILIVDDLPQNVILLEAILRAQHVDIIKAYNGKQALEALNTHIFSMALLDVLMPEMDGFELASRIRKHPDHTLLPIIFITANNLDDLSIFKGYQAGAVDYITKPFNKDILISKIKVFTELAQQRQEIIEQSDRMEALLEEQMGAQKTISEQLKLEQTYSKVSGCFVGNFEIQNSFSDALKIIGELIGASGACMYDYKTISNTFELGTLWQENNPAELTNELADLFKEKLKKYQPKLIKKQIVKNAAEVLAPSTDFLMVPVHVFNELQSILIFFNQEYPLQFFDRFERLGIFTDLISSALERIEVQRKLRHTERLAGIGEIATGIAHELNQPLNTISLGLDNILLAIKSGKATDEYLDKKTKKIHENILRTRTIIDHVRTFSRDQDGYINSEFSINDSIRNAISLVAEQYNNHGIQLEQNLTDALPKVVGNTYKFEEVVLNFLSNAMHAVEKQKETAGMNYYGQINIRTLMENNTLILDVKDNGCGIPEHILNKIMQPFFTTKEEGKGTGLGLSIAYGIIKDMKGIIDINSSEGIGTSVRVLI
ncbi:MAG: response regulator, partial [Bacteroidales bacterium]